LVAKFLYLFKIELLSRYFNNLSITKKLHPQPPLVVITLTDEDHACCVFEINYNGIISTIQCFLKKEKKVLHLTEIDIEGPGAGFYGAAMVRMIDEVGKEFCRMYKTDSVVLQGGKRTTGRYIGQYPKPRTVNAR
jgi:hypothetical protein